MDLNNATDGDLWKYLEEADTSDKGSIYLELGFRNLGRDNFNEALSCAEAAEVQFVANGDLMGKSVALYLNACALNATGEYEKSIEYSEKASEGFREYSEESFLGKAAWEIAIANGRMGRFDEAVEAFISSLNLLTSAGENYLVTKVGADYGELLGSYGKQEKALSVFYRTKEVAVTLNSPLEVAHLDDRIAACLIDLARGQEALDHLKSALDVIAYTGGKKDYAQALYRYGWTLQTFSYHNEAIANLEKARDLFYELNDIAQAAECDFQIAHARSNRREYEEADAIYSRLREVFKSLGKTESAILCDVNRGMNLHKSGHLEAASNIYRSLLDDPQVQRYGFIQRNLTYSLTRLLNQWGHYTDALKLIETIDIDEIGENKIALRFYQNTLARSLVGCNRLDDGQAALQPILSMNFEKGLEAGYAEALETLGLIAELKSDDAEAMNLRGKAIAYYLAGGEIADAQRLAGTFTFAHSETLEKSTEPRDEMSKFSFGFTAGE